MRRQRQFAQIDVFSPTPYLGNPVAVILEAEDHEDADMQRIARWTNLSETTFVLPPTTREADYRLRIFTPGGELPFAGHPTLGSAHAWLELDGTPKIAERLVQECDAGLVEVRRRAGLLSFAAPPTRRSGDIEEEYLGQIVDAFGITKADDKLKNRIDFARVIAFGGSDEEVFRDFGCGLRRPQDASSSSPFFGIKFLTSS